MVAAADKPLVLPQIQIASPCPADWSAMRGDDRVRHCNDCRKNVFNIASLTEAEAAALIQEHDGRLCVRIFQRADGTVLTADCPVGLAALRQKLYRGWAGVVVLAASLLIGSLTAFGMTRFAQRVNQAGALQQLRQSLNPPMPMLGDVCVPITPAGS